MAFVAASPLAVGVPADAEGKATCEGDATWEGDGDGAAVTADGEVEGLADGPAEPHAANSTAETRMTSADPRGNRDL